MKRYPPNEKFDIDYYIYLYRNDLENLLSILANNFSDIKAKGVGYKLGNPFQIDEYLDLSKEEFSTLSIEASGIKNAPQEKPFSSIRISFGSYPSIDIPCESHFFQGIARGIEVILKNRKRKLTSFILNPFWYGFSGALLVLMYLIILLISYKYKKIFIFSILPLMFFLFMIIFFKFIRNLINAKYKVQLFKENFSDKKTFLERNKDQIVLIIISVISGAIITTLVTSLIHHSK